MGRGCFSISDRSGTVTKCGSVDADQCGRGTASHCRYAGESTAGGVHSGVLQKHQEAAEATAEERRWQSTVGEGDIGDFVPAGMRVRQRFSLYSYFFF